MSGENVVLYGYNAFERTKEWSKILKLTDLNSVPKFWYTTDASVNEYMKQADMRTIDQDVVRTRANEEYFQSPKIRHVMKNTLLKFCTYHKISYLQGLNEILAPLFMLDYSLYEINYNLQLFSHSDELSSSQHSDNLISQSFDSNDDESSTKTALSSFNIQDYTASLIIFETFLFKFSPVIFLSGGMKALQLQLVLFHLLLHYHDAELANYLLKHGMNTDIYAPSWFITIFARRLPVHIALHLWDLLIRVNKPHMTIFIAVAFLKKCKSRLMTFPVESLPEFLTHLRFVSTDEIDDIFAKAITIERATSKSVIYTLCKYSYDPLVSDGDRDIALEKLMSLSSLEVYPYEIATELTFTAQTDSSRNSNGASTPRGQPRSQYNTRGYPSSPYTPKSSALIEETISKYVSAPRPKDNLLENFVPGYKSFQSFCRYNIDVVSGNGWTHVGSVAIPRSVVTRYLIIDCRTKQPNSDKNIDIVIDGSLDIKQEHIESICSMAQTKLKDAANEPELGLLSPAAAATLALLWSCHDSEIHFCILGNDQEMVSKATSDATKDTETEEHTEKKSKNKFNKHQKFAAALIVLGFSRISVVTGLGLDLDQHALIDGNIVIRSSNSTGLTVRDYLETSLPEVMRPTILSLSSLKDGHTALSYCLYQCAVTIDEKGVLYIPQDGVLTQKVNQFALARSHEKLYEDDGSGDNKLSQLKNILSILGGIHDDFVEQTFFPQVNNAMSKLTDAVAKLDNFTGYSTSQSEDTISNPVLYIKKLKSELVNNSVLQSVDNGKSVAKELKQGTYHLAPIADDIHDVEIRLKSLRNNLVNIHTATDRCVRKFV